MSLQTTIEDVTSRLRQARFANEQAVSQGVVLRVLQSLDWNTWNTGHKCCSAGISNRRGARRFCFVSPGRPPMTTTQTFDPNLNPVEFHAFNCGGFATIETSHNRNDAMSKSKKSTIEVQRHSHHHPVPTLSDYICAHGHRPLQRQGANRLLIQNWLRNRNTVEFLGVWEQFTIPVLIPSNSMGLENRPVSTASSSPPTAGLPPPMPSG